MTEFEYKTVYSRRRTVGIVISPDGSITVKAPAGTPDAVIKALLSRHEKRISSKLAELERLRSERAPLPPPYSEKELSELKRRAKLEIPPRVKYYAEIMGVKPGSISFRFQKTRWGSCSSDGNLSFNCLLMLAPAEVRDSVIVHELCHLIHHDHSHGFYEELYKFFPYYAECGKWLNKNGPELISRLYRG